MTRLTYKQQNNLHRITVEIHRAQTREDLVYLAIFELPQILGIHYTVWHNRLKGRGLKPEDIETKSDHQVAIIDYLESINNHLLTHPIITGLGIQETMEIPREVVTTMDFASKQEIKKTAIYNEAYKHLEIENHAVVEFFDPTGKGVMICFNGHKDFSQSQKHMIQCIRDHFEIAYCRLNSARSRDLEIQKMTGSCVLDSFSKREKEVFPYVVQGKTNPEIGIILGISSRTVEKHVASILEKSGLESRRFLMNLRNEPQIG